MGDVSKHQEWHGHLEHVELTADEALERAEQAQAQNVLYQNNIQV